MREKKIHVILQGDTLLVGGPPGPQVVTPFLLICVPSVAYVVEMYCNVNIDCNKCYRDLSQRLVQYTLPLQYISTAYATFRDTYEQE